MKSADIKLFDGRQAAWLEAPKSDQILSVKIVRDDPTYKVVVPWNQ